MEISLTVTYCYDGSPHGCLIIVCGLSASLQCGFSCIIWQICWKPFCYVVFLFWLSTWIVTLCERVYCSRCSTLDYNIEVD